SGLYLLQVFRLPHDSPAEHLSVPRLMFSLIFLGLGFYLLPALFKYNADGEKQRPNGAIYAWVDSFLLPEKREGKLPWSGNLKKALDDARQEKKLVFIDFTGVTCVNCKINEEGVFSLKEIQDHLEKYKLVQLYTDTVPDELYPAKVREQ